MPVGTWGAALIMLPPLVFIFLILATATLKTWLVSGGMAGLGILSFWLMENLKARRLCEFYVSPPMPIPLSELEHHHPGSSPSPAPSDGADEEQAAAGPGGDGEEEEDDLSESLYPGGGQRGGPRPPAALALAARVARSMSPRGGGMDL
jgi:hypothetical protein